MVIYMTSHKGGVPALKKHTSKNGAPSNGAVNGSAQTNGTRATSLPPARFAMPNKNDRKRITLIVSATLDHNIELFSLATGRMKTEIVITALSEFLRRNNVDPNQDRRTAVSELLRAQSPSR